MGNTTGTLFCPTERDGFGVVRLIPPPALTGKVNESFAPLNSALCAVMVVWMAALPQLPPAVKTTVCPELLGLTLIVPAPEGLTVQLIAYPSEFESVAAKDRVEPGLSEVTSFGAIATPTLDPALTGISTVLTKPEFQQLSARKRIVPAAPIVEGAR